MAPAAVIEDYADSLATLLQRATEWAGSDLAKARPSLAEPLANLLPIALAAAGAGAGAILLLSPDGERVVLAAAGGRLPRAPDGPAGWSCAGGVAQALRTAAVHLLPDGERVLLPLVGSGQLVGAFLLSQSCPDPGRQWLLELLASQAAASIVIARLRDRLDRWEQPHEDTLQPRPAADVALSRRQQQVLDLIKRGHSGPEIASRLGLSPATVKDHTAALYARFRARGRAHLVALASHVDGDREDQSPKSR